ncbi:MULTISPECIES: TrmH family RNA methyltransferase [Mycolicibacterium]|uniref:TrmH family RNA methyltransferase n=1 Tax=Mycolicibacterium TaxID=1866885 RepID=UPI0007ECF254|nr:MULTISPECIES: RNA methyltransferase [Mycolicibacterium]MDG5772086.1 RNA methyltransferase [Mycolicibacterium fortuitum]MDG5785477.1 RNA methyltransferase [Mycolicibacterium fortuitum]NOP94269.1 RNA methyltransferase [Mycolicibacterium fortuitum]OBK08488.1 RNA methyltransferase [Mycolicibacterium fortuitum]UBV13157.1 RNA methyltransferase [Mycolicibacterium fortuitum]
MAAAIKLQRHIGRRRAARFLAEGPNLVEAALRRGLVSEVFVTEAALDRFAALLVDAPVQVVTERAAKALSDTVTPVGLVAVCRMPEVSLDEVLAGAPRLVAVAVETSEPGNAGTLIRLADAMGADAMILAGNSVDPFNGKCLRSSAGSIFGLPVVQAPDVDALMAALRAAGLQVLATTLDGETPLPDVDLTAPTAWLFGSEAHGLSPEIAAAADARVTIPMRGSAESLNVAAAAAICLYASAHALS